MNTIKGALEIYKKELRSYKKWINEKKKTYGEDSHPMESWDNGDYTMVMEWNKTISGMEKILGLTKREIKKFNAEVGL